MADNPAENRPASPPKTRRMIRPTVRAVRPTPRTNMLVIGISYAVFALSLILQPRRWGMTPAYHNLLIIMPAQAWGACFAVVSAGLAAALWKGARYRWVSVLALSLGLAITTTWTAAFIIRWATSGATTPETWVSWAVFDFLLLRALMLLGYEEVRVRVHDDDGGNRA